MTNADMLQIIQFVCNQEQSTNIIGIPQYNQLLQFHQTQVIKKKTQEYILLSEWERAEKINLTFQGLKKVPDSPITLDSNGVSTLPTDFLLDDGITYTQTIGSVNKERGINVCSGSEFKFRQTQSLKKPSQEYPIAQIIGGKIQVKPELSNPVLNFQYIRKPTTPYLDWYVDSNNNIIFRTEGDSVNVLTGDIYNQISSLVLTGITPEFSDDYYLYWELAWNPATSNYELNFYADSSKSTLVAQGLLSGTQSSSFTSDATISPVLVNSVSSGISGSVVLKILPYLSLYGNTLEEIISLSINTTASEVKYYWEIVCTHTITQGSTTATRTTFNLYSDIAKQNKQFTISNLGTSLSGQISFKGVTGNINIQNSFLENVTGIGSSVITDFRIQYPVVYNQNNYYYKFNDSVITNQTFQVYSDSNRTQLIMSGSTSYYDSQIIRLYQNNGSGYSGWARINTPYSWTLSGDIIYYQITACSFVGINPSNSTNGTIYLQVLNGGQSGYLVKVFSDANHTNMVSYGAMPDPNGTISLSGSITGYVTLQYDGDQLTGLSFGPNAGHYTHDEAVQYQSGSWSESNIISIQQNNRSGNSYLTLPTSKTVECELLEEDKIDIMQGILKDIALNISREDILKLASEL